MTIEKIKKLVNTKDYDFLRTDEHLGKNICLLTLGGSIAYGTNLENGGDVDIRGCTLESPKDIIGFGNFEQIVETNTDTVIYGFNKLVNLLMSCNPNTIEMLGCKPEHYLYLNNIGQELINNREMFLSQRAAYTFGNYAGQQLNRMMNALAKDRLGQSEKEKNLVRSVTNAINSFSSRYSHFENGMINLNIGNSIREGFDKEILVDMNVAGYPLREINGVMSEMVSIARSFDKTNHRSHKKDDVHLNKHAMHLVRLYLMGIDIFENKEIVTYREKDRDMLLDIRKGKYMNADGTYNDSFFDLQKELSEKFEYASKNTDLPEKPDINKIQDFVMDVNAKIVLNHNLEMLESKDVLNYKNEIIER